MNNVNKKGYLVFYSGGGWSYDYLYFESTEINEIADFIYDLEKENNSDYDIVSYSELSLEDSKLIELYKQKKRGQ